jgi:hypothetical protein
MDKLMDYEDTEKIKDTEQEEEELDEIKETEQEEEVARVHRAMISFKILTYSLFYMIYVSTVSLYFIRGHKFHGPNRNISDYVSGLSGVGLLIGTGFA